MREEKIFIVRIGKCKVLSNSTFNCTCAPGWEGIHCENKIDLCKSNPCQNKALCRHYFSIIHANVLVAIFLVDIVK